MNFSVTVVEFLRYILPGAALLLGLHLTAGLPFDLASPGFAKLQESPVTLSLLVLSISYVLGHFVRIWTQILILYPFRRIFHKHSGFSGLFDSAMEETIRGRVRHLFGETAADVNVFQLSYQ